MSKYEPSIEERKKKLLEEMMTAGAAGFTSAAPAEGPVAGFDPLMQKFDKILRRRRKKQAEDKKADLDKAPKS